MRPVINDTEQHQFAGCQPFLDIAIKGGGRSDGQDCGARLAALDFNDEVLRPPDPHADRSTGGGGTADPFGVAAAQAGPVEAGRGVIIRRSHMVSAAAYSTG